MSPELLTPARGTNGAAVRGTNGASAPVTFRPAALPPTASRAEETELVRSAGHAAGYAAGYAAGARAAARDAEAAEVRRAEEHARAEATRDAVVGKALGILEAAAAVTRDRTVPVLEDSRRTLHDAALDLAEAVLGHELAPAGGGAQHVLDRVLALPVDLGVHTVRLHPTDHAHVSGVIAESGSRVELPAGVELVADPRLAPGDVVSEYPDGWLDSRIGSALDRARRALEEAAQ